MLAQHDLDSLNARGTPAHRTHMVAGVSNCSRHGYGRVLNSAHTGFVACVLAFTACTMVQEAAAQGSVATDRAALVELYEATGGAGWRGRTNWLSEEPIGDWHGVTTDDGGRVSVLSLEENGLKGTLPPEVGNLSHMRQVHLWGNALTGPVPRALWSLPLELVALTGNKVTGTLPPEVGDLVDLRWVDLGWTEMTGALPQSMTNLSLEYLRITGSYLCAPADDAFQAWLETIGEFDGQTCMPETGSVGTDRAALVALYNATDGANWRNNAYWLSGRPLGEWYGVATDGTGRVVELDLGFGELTRELPPEIGNLSRLRILVLSDNFDLTGPLPPELGNLRRLEILALTSTAFYGLLPASVCNLSNLGYLGLSWSEMRGPLPQCLTNLSELDSFGTWETFLCAPANVAFQTWLTGLSETSGIETCEPSTFTVAPVELQLRGAVAQLITVAQTGGGDPVMWTAVSTQPWLRVTPAASIGTGRVIVSADPVMLPPGGGAATGAVMVTADGTSVRVPVTVVREAAAAELSLPAIEPTGRLGLDGRAETGTPTGRRAPARTERRARRATDRLPDRDPLQYRLTPETDDTPAGDRAALTALHNATTGDNWWRNTHWLSERPLGEWYGVTTDSGGRVTALELSDNRLTGAVPDVLGSLTRLELLDLSRNALAGGIPAALGELAGLRQLNLGFNVLTGAIPPGLGNLSNLESLSLHWNQFRTPIPPELGNLNRLEVLNLEYALVTGQIPSALGNLANLTVLDLRDNFGLTGPIPAALGNLTSLEWLGLGGNRLEGAIPSALGRLTNLRTLSLTNNLLSGGIPPELGDLSNLGNLGLHNNSLTGIIPPELGRLSRLFYLGLHENALAGPIPASLGGTGLLWLYLHENDLTGAIPAELGEIENLRFVQLQDNSLSGPIPSELGELDNLKVLDVHNNALTGLIPAALGRLSSLEVLDLSENELTGPIPSDLGTLSNLWWLDLRDNALTGPIPSELSSLSELVWLDLAGNGLTGPIPSELRDLERLMKLSLWRNNLTGSIPWALGALSKLEQLNLGENALTGSIPAEVGDLTNLRQLYLAGNALSGLIPSRLGDLANLDVLHLRQNALIGPLPGEIENLSNLGWLDVAANGLTGTLPSALGNVSTLRALSLSGNRLTGPLPSELTMLPELDYLWIDETGLCAPADASFQAWLAALVQFSGTTCVPEGGGGGGFPQPPMADAGPDQTGVREGALVTLDGSGSSDPDDDPLKYRWDQYGGERVTLSSPDVVNPTFTAPRELTADVVLSFRLLVTDPGGRFDTDTVEVIVTVTDEDNERPGKLPPPIVSAATPYSLTVEWLEPENTGPAITDYDVQYREGGSGDGFTDAQHQGPARTATLTGLMPDTVYEVQVRATNATGTGDWSEPGEGKTKTLQTGDQIYYFPHLAVGASWQTTITYINYSPEEVTCQTDFISDHGSPLMVSFAELGTVDSRTDVLPPGGSVHQETNVDLSAPLAPGWALANCSGPVKASLLYRQHNSEGVPTAEAGVNATAVPATRFVTFAEQGEGQFGTGVAYANPSATAALVTFTARDTAGEVLASVDRELSPGGHDAHGMAELFGLTSFTGSIEVTSTEPIVSLSLNFEADSVFSSLPPGELDASAQGSTTYYFPHLAVGASWQTTITYINYSPDEVTCQTDFISDHGTPLMVSFAALGTVVSRTDVLPPGGSVHQETNVDLNASLTPGWARATCSGPVKASLLYRLHNSEGTPTAEAGVNATAVPATRFVTFAEQGEGQFWDRRCLCKPFPHIGPCHLYCQGRSWGGAGQRRSDTVTRRS